MNATDTDMEAILLVDDTPANLQVLYHTLDGRHWRLLVAKDGPTALKIAGKTKLNLILLDIMMPEMDGYQVCRRLKADPDTAGIPVIFLSALGETEDKVQGLKLGAVDYITKPFQAEEVIARVNTHLTIHRLKRQVEIKNGQLEHELKVVADVQRELLPAALPRIEGLELGAFYRTSRYAGGDYYDVAALPDNCWGLLIADAEGHSTPAAVRMAMACALFRSYSGPPAAPDQMLDHLNNHLCKVAGMSFITALYAVYDPARRLVRLARAGHPYPIVWRRSTREAAEVVCEGVMPLGFDTYTKVPVSDVTLEPGDRLLLYTDGITERFNNQDQPYGEHRLVQALAGAPDASAQQLADALIQDVEAFAAGCAPEDDQALITALVV